MDIYEDGHARDTDGKWNKEVMAKVNKLSPIPKVKYGRMPDRILKETTIEYSESTDGKLNQLIPKCAKKCLNTRECSWFWYHEKVLKRQRLKLS